MDLGAAQSANDKAYGILMLITYFSVFTFPFLLIAYVILVINVRGRKQTST